MLCSSIRKQGEQERELEERESSLAVKLSKFWAFVGGGGGESGTSRGPGLTPDRHSPSAPASTSGGH